MNAYTQVELGLNVLGSWFWAFVSDGWNLFDSVIVVVSVVRCTHTHTHTHAHTHTHTHCVGWLEFV